MLSLVRRTHLPPTKRIAYFVPAGLRFARISPLFAGVDALRTARIVALVALAFLGLSAIVGAIPMLLHPAGEPWSMPQSLLRYSPFHSYLIPGIILLVANGLLSLWVLWLTVRRHSCYGWWVAAQGCVLLGWLIVEMVLLRLVVWPHYLYGAVALTLVAAGIALMRAPRNSG
jgi:hypothetical protein